MTILQNPLPGYSHLDLSYMKLLASSPGLMIRRKFRWVARLFKDRKEIKLGQFVKMGARPEAEFDQNGLTDLEHFTECSFRYLKTKDTKEENWTPEDLKNFDEITFCLFDGCGMPLELWTIGDVSKVVVALALDEINTDNEDSIWEVTFNCCCHNYENFCPVAPIACTPS